MVEIENGEISDDDLIKEATNESWFGKRMTCVEKWEASRPWWNNLIVKLEGRSIGYHYFWRRIQAMWRTQT